MHGWLVAILLIYGVQHVSANQQYLTARTDIWNDQSNGKMDGSEWIKSFWETLCEHLHTPNKALVDCCLTLQKKAIDQ